MTQNYDRCGTKIIVKHALPCKKGGMVHIHQNDVTDEWRYMCGCAFSFGQVKCELEIFSCVNRTNNESANYLVADKYEHCPTYMRIINHISNRNDNKETRGQGQ